MMPQREENEPLLSQEIPDYGRYEGAQAYADPGDKSFYEQPQQKKTHEKIYAQPPDNANVLRLIAFGMALFALIVFAVICLIIVGGTSGWISFCAASLAIFIIAAIAIDKIK